jgi:hypothetical protein
VIFGQQTGSGEKYFLISLDEKEGGEIKSYYDGIFC